MTETIPFGTVEGGEGRISLTEMLEAFSMAIDLINPQLSGHHLKTCYAACRLARHLRLDRQDCARIFSAAIMHDVGAIALSDITSALLFEIGNPHQHAEIGFVMLNQFPPFRRFSELVRHHHVRWNHGEGRRRHGNIVSDLSHLLHLADRVAVLADQAKGDYKQIPVIMAEIQGNSGSHFKPEFVAAFAELAQQDAFWLDLYSSRLFGVVLEMSAAPEISLGLDGMMDFAKFYSRIIDTRSRFTSTHSSGVAASASMAGDLMGYDRVTVCKLRIAGYLHDLGKLAVPREILEKNGPLNDNERRIMRAHTYYTRRILERVHFLADVAVWASNHHENLSGDGYPFRLKGDQICRESRIIAVADVFTALREERPYRPAMNREMTEKVLGSMVEEGKLDRDIVSFFHNNFTAIDRAQKTAQQEELLDLTAFWQSIQCLDTDEGQDDCLAAG